MIIHIIVRPSCSILKLKTIITPSPLPEQACRHFLEEIRSECLKPFLTSGTIWNVAEDSQVQGFNGK